MKLLLDQGMPRSAAALLRKKGFDAVHTVLSVMILSLLGMQGKLGSTAVSAGRPRT